MKGKDRKKELKQYFTPPRVAEFIVGFLKKMQKDGEPCGDFIDPSCGEGAFIRAAIRGDVAPGGRYHGVDRDHSLKDDWKADSVLCSDSCVLEVADSLVKPCLPIYGAAAGNPPFGLMEIDDPERFSRFELFRLAYRGNQAPRTFPVEVLFLELFIKLLLPKGVCGVILPVGIFTNHKMKFIRQWLRQNVTIEGVLTLETPVFLGEGTSAATGVLFARKVPPAKPLQVFWASASSVDLSGTRRDGLDEVLYAYTRGRQKLDREMMAFFTGSDSLEAARWDPHYHHPRYELMMTGISSGPFPVKPLNELMDASCILTGYKGPQVKSEGIDPIPFVTSRHVGVVGLDLSSRDSYIDRGSPPDVPRTRLMRDDVMLVRSGEGCVGKAVVAGSRDAGANVRSEIYVIRPDPGVINPYYLALYFNCFRLPLKSGKRENPTRLISRCVVWPGVWGLPISTNRRFFQSGFLLSPWRSRRS